MEEKYSEEWYRKRCIKPLNPVIEDNFVGEYKFIHKEDETLLTIDPENYSMFYEMVHTNPALTEKSKAQFEKKFWKKYVMSKIN